MSPVCLAKENVCSAASKEIKLDGKIHCEPQARRIGDEQGQHTGYSGRQMVRIRHWGTGPKICEHIDGGVGVRVDAAQRVEDSRVHRW